MNPQSKAELSQLLSAYVDGVLDEAHARSVEAIVAQDPDARHELEELKALKGLLAAKKPIPQSLGFWTRLSSELERRKREEENLLPFPRKYLPGVVVSAALVVVIVGVVLFQQRASLVDFVSRQSERMQKAVEDNVLKGSIMPLFSHIDKNQALQFAMFGTLPLDAKAQTELRVNEDSVKGYTINVDKKGARKTPTVTVKEFVDEVQPTSVQLEVIDSLLDLGRRKLEGSVFVDEDRSMAVNPELSRLNRVMLSGIAAALEPVQRLRFEKFLQLRRAPYMLAGGRASSESRERIFRTMKTPQRTDRFLVLTPESLLVTDLQIDIDSLHRHFQDMEEAGPEVAVRMNNLIRRIGEHEVTMRQRYHVPVPHVRVFADSELFSIQIGNEWEEMPAMPHGTWVKPRTQIRGFIPAHPEGQFFNFQFRGDDSSFFINMDLDSLMIKMTQEGGFPGIEVFKGDPRSRNRTFQFDFGRLKQMIDSAMVAKKRPHSKLDSLMREMEKRERLHEQNQKEDEPRDRERF